MFTLLCSNSPGLFGLAIWNSCSLTTPCFSLPAAPQQPPLHLLCLGLIILSIHINEIIYCLSFHDRPTSPYIASLCSSILCHVLEFFFLYLYTLFFIWHHIFVYLLIWQLSSGCFFVWFWFWSPPPFWLLWLLLQQVWLCKYHFITLLSFHFDEFSPQRWYC